MGEGVNGPDDYCRECRGKRMTPEKNGHGPDDWVWQNCRGCNRGGVAPVGFNPMPEHPSEREAP